MIDEGLIAERMLAFRLKESTKLKKKRHVPAPKREFSRLEREQQIITLLRAKQDLTRQEMGAALGINEVTAGAYAKRLLDRGILSRNGVGGGMKSKYRLAEYPENNSVQS